MCYNVCDAKALYSLRLEQTVSHLFFQNLNIRLLTGNVVSVKYPTSGLPVTRCGRKIAGLLSTSRTRWALKPKRCDFKSNELRWSLTAIPRL